MALNQDSKKSPQEQHNDILGKKAVEALKKNAFAAEYLATKAEARARLLELIPEKGSVGVGGSDTIQNLDVLSELAKRGNTILFHTAPGLTPEESVKIRHQQLDCDCFICSTNAVTLDGKLMNMDGTGNRVAAMIFGPKKTIIVAGINKIVKDLDGAQERIEMYASPRNNIRLNYTNPCVTSGVCQDCQGPTRICNIQTIIYRKPKLSDITVLILGEEMGF